MFPARLIPLNAQSTVELYVRATLHAGKTDYYARQRLTLQD